MTLLLFSLGCAKASVKDTNSPPGPPRIESLHGPKHSKIVPVWTEIKGVPGVGYWQESHAAHQILLLFGGYRASAAAVRDWESALYREYFAQHGPIAMVAVLGPKEVDYKSREIKNSSLAEFVGGLSDIKQVIMIAHSSGMYPALEFLEYFSKKPARPEVTLFNLDGIPLPQHFGDMLKNYFPVYAYTASQTSTWAYVMQQESRRVPIANPIGLRVASDVCAENGPWCMHVTLINKRPHNRHSFDLEKDYRNFNPPRGVETGYLEKYCFIGECQ